MNRLDIATALAARFAPGALTPPSGETDIRSSTYLLPATITQTPCVLVFPPEETFAHSTRNRQSVQEWRVVFYLGQRGDTAPEMTRAYGWADVLADALVGQVHLGESADGVAYAVVAGMRTGSVTYASQDFLGIELGIAVHTSEGKNFTG